MAETEEPSRPPPPEATDMGRAFGVARPWLEGCGLFLAALVACFLGYLAATVPGRWFGGEPSRTWGAAQLSLTRGSGVLDRNGFPGARMAVGDGASTGRASLQFAPVLVLFAALAFRSFARRLRERALERTGAECLSGDAEPS